MKTQRPILALTACSVAFLTCITLSNGQTPVGPKWWPSEWGPDDQRGAANRLTPQKVLEAAKLIHSGKVYRLCCENRSPGRARISVE